MLVTAVAALLVGATYATAAAWAADSAAATQTAPSAS